MYSGKWWGSNLITHVFFYSLNEWQIRNIKLHTDLTDTQYNTDRANLKTMSKSRIDARQNPTSRKQTKHYSANHYSNAFRTPSVSQTLVRHRRPRIQIQFTSTRTTERPRKTWILHSQRANPRNNI
jgi:hypothetical protein